jgi:hypothetical protein
LETRDEVNLPAFHKLIGIVPVDDFACPECGQPVSIKMLAR